MTTMARPTGIIPPLTTPFTTDGDVYEKGLRDLLEFQIEALQHRHTPHHRPLDHLPFVHWILKFPSTGDSKVGLHPHELPDHHKM